MDPMTNDREIIRRVLSPYASIRYAYDDIQNMAVFDDETGRYLIMSYGWMEGRRLHGCLIHVEIIGDKIWIQRDGTEKGVADELVESGIPRSRIVLGFWDPEARKLGDFAAA